MALKIDEKEVFKIEYYNSSDLGYSYIDGSEVKASKISQSALNDVDSTAEMTATSSDYISMKIDNEDILVVKINYIGSDIYILYVDSESKLRTKRKSINTMVDKVIGELI